MKIDFFVNHNKQSEVEIKPGFGCFRFLRFFFLNVTCLKTTNKKYITLPNVFIIHCNSLTEKKIFNFKSTVLTIQVHHATEAVEESLSNFRVTQTVAPLTTVHSVPPCLRPWPHRAASWLVAPSPARKHERHLCSLSVTIKRQTVTSNYYPT